MNGNFKNTKALLVQILAILLLFILAFIGLRRLNLVKFPAFIENLIAVDDFNSDEYINDSYKILEYINKSEAEEKNSLYPEITSDNLKNLLNSLNVYDSYYWETTSNNYYNTSLKSINCKSRISGDRYNVEITSDNGNSLKKCVSNGERTAVYITENKITKKAAYEAGLSDFYSDASIVSIDYFKDFDFSDANCEINTIKKDDFSLVSISYTYDRNGTQVKNVFLISLDFGVVLFSECYENDTLVYSMSTNSIYPLTSFEDNLFNVE